jgi:hypothetical protein
MSQTRNVKCLILFWDTITSNWSCFNKHEIPHSSDHNTVLNVKVIFFWDVMLCSLVCRSGVHKSQMPGCRGA